MSLPELFKRYEEITSRADQAFEQMRQQYPDCVRCNIHCTDCCYAVFGLFMIEAAYLHNRFRELDRRTRQEAIGRCDQTEQDLSALQERLKEFENDEQMRSYTLARERIRCPLLNDRAECILYPYRPVTCRVYGIPTAIQGKARVCQQSGFQDDEVYPTFDLDAAYRELYQLSGELLEGANVADAETRASLLISVPKAIRTPVQELIAESPAGPR